MTTVSGSLLTILLVSGVCWADESPAALYPTAHDAPLQPTEKVAAETETHRQVRVEFNGIAGDRVPGFLYLPKDDLSQETEKRHPAVLLQYGTGGSKNTNYIVQIGRQFVSSGFVVLTIDAPQRGERRPPGKKDSLLNQLSRQQFAQYCGDYARAVDYLVSRSDVDADRIGYVGISWGAVTGVTYAAHDLRIKAVTSIVGGGDLMGLLSTTASDDSQRALPSFDPVDHVGRIAPRPLLMINVTHDLLMPWRFSTALHKAAGPGSKVLWYEADHYFNGVDRQEIMQTEVITFMRDSMPVRP